MRRVLLLGSLLFVACRSPARSEPMSRAAEVDAAGEAPKSPPEAPEPRCDDSVPAKTKLEGWPARKLVDLDRTKISSGGGFDTEGVAIRAFEPVPCPEGAMCKPQPPAHVVVADGTARDRTLVLFTPDPKAVPLNVSLRVSAMFCPNRSSSYGATVNEGQLRAWTK